MTSYGLSDSTIQTLYEVFGHYPQISHVLLFGSRAQGTDTKRSDIDLAISAPDMNKNEFAKLWDEIDSLPLIHKIDCVHLETLGNEALRRKILETGKILWQPNSQTDLSPS